MSGTIGEYYFDSRTNFLSSSQFKKIPPESVAIVNLEAFARACRTRTVVLSCLAELLLLRCHESVVVSHRVYIA